MIINLLNFTIMTHSVMTSVLTSNTSENKDSIKSSRSCTSNNYYSVDVTDFDGENYVFDIEASSYEEANDKATALLGSTPIYNMNIYLLDF